MLAADLARGGFELGGPEIVGRDVDEVSPEIERLGEGEHFRAIDAVGQDQALGLAVGLGLVAAEAVGAGEPGEGRKLGVWKLRGEAIIARRERARKRAGKQRRMLSPILSAGAEQGP